MKVPKIIKRTFDSGFRANIILRPNFKQRFFGIMVDFGSSDPQSIPGLAHFLEHKLFAKKEGDLSASFEELGADVNAFTSFNETMFYCSGIAHDQKLIKLLFKLVGEPYFTSQNVAQEEPIIQQELAMYQDEPNWQVNNALMQSLFASSNLGLDVAGTADSIARISAKDLEKTYQNNYLSAKMQFVACGDFSTYQQQNIMRQVNHLQRQYFSSEKRAKDSNQTSLGDMKDKILTVNNDSNLFGLGLRFENFKKVLSSLDLAQFLVEIMLESKLSVVSPWFEQMKRQGLLHNSLQIGVNYTRQGSFATIFGISDHPDKVIQAIKSEIAKPLLLKDVEKKQFFELKKREWLSQTARIMNDVSSLAIEYTEDSLDHENLFANVNQLQLITFADFRSICTKLMQDYQICSVRLKKGA